jgi:hypothetical protein
VLQVSIGEVWNAYSTGHTQPNAALTYSPDPATVAQQGNFPPLFQLTGGNVVQVRSPLMKPFTTAPEYTSVTDSSQARDILGQLKDADYNPFTFLS